jgi:hypothetical protein
MRAVEANMLSALSNGRVAGRLEQTAVQLRRRFAEVTVTAVPGEVGGTTGSTRSTDHLGDG